MYPSISHAPIGRLSGVLMGLLWMVNASAQDPEFTLFNQNQAYLNPASVGQDCHKADLQYRNQWHELVGNYSTLFASYEVTPANLRFNGKEFQNFNVGLGGYLIHDQAGRSVLNSTKLGLQVSAYGALSSRFRMGAGLEFGILDKSLDWNRLTFPDMIDPTQGFIYGTAISPNQQGNTKFTDISAGLRVRYALLPPQDGYSTPWLECGFAAHHLNEPNESLFEGPSVLPVKLSGYAHGTLFLGKERPAKIHFGSFYRRQGDFQHFLSGFSFGYRANDTWFEIGPWYRGMPGFQYNDALILAMNMGRGGLGFRYSMDMTSSRLSPSGWAHEMGLVMQLECKGKTRNTADCWECDNFYKRYHGNKKERREFGNNTKRERKGVVRRRGIFKTERSFKPPSKFSLWLKRLFGNSQAVGYGGRN